MAVVYTEDQMKVIETRGSNILVSAAAGSGKTAVLVERIIRMVSEGDSPVDIDRLLVVTFTNAAAAEMKERITQALSEQVEKRPESIHLQKQLTLVHNAQITTIDSFCLYLIRNHFHEIGLDPDFRVADSGEVSLLKQEVMDQLLEERFQEKEEAFLTCVEYFAPTGREKRLEEQILTLYEFAMSYPWPEDWLLEHAADYERREEEPFWLKLLREHADIMLREAAQILELARQICCGPAGPYMYEPAIASDLEQVEEMLTRDGLDELCSTFQHLSFTKLSSKRDENVDIGERERVKALRSEVKDILTGLASRYFAKPLDEQRKRMEACEPAVRMLLTLTLQFKERLDTGKRDKGILDFHDMEHLALHILLEKTPDGVQPSQIAHTYRSRFAEILIDEYQDSNLVQEYLLQSISGEDDGRFNRFMVGDVKQSIYRFRLARPELFMDKFDRYSKESGPEKRIDLKQNFRSRHQVTERVNRIFDCLMGRDLGGVEYDADAALYPGAAYPEPENGTCSKDVYQPEILLSVRRKEEKLDEKEQEALCIAGRIRQLAGTLPVFDKESGGLRPARFSDMVILLRTTSGWDETFRKVLIQQGIPVHVTSRTGYFSAPEVQMVLNFLRVLNNPYQDIALFGVMKSGYCGFTDQDAAWIRAEMGAPGRRLYACMIRYAEEGQRQELREKIGLFLKWLEEFRRCTVYLPIHKLIGKFLESTGSLYSITAMPGGTQRRANVEMLVHKAEEFEKTSYFGLFHFIRYMGQIEKYDIDYGEANIQDENADAVRIMSIHKSKGLEFPVCFVSGLSKRFNLQDTTQPVIMDMDYGVAVDYVDPELRIKGGTLKKNVLAGKLVRDSMGEELRVLYVAMTRAREKLILTGTCKETQVPSDEERPGLGVLGETVTVPGRLPFYIRSGARSYLDWLLPVCEQCGFEVDYMDMSGLLSNRVVQEISAEARWNTLSEWTRTQPEPGEVKQRLVLLKEKLETVYPHENLGSLYTKTTVSELKKAGMREMEQEAFRLFEEKEVVPYIPRFMGSENQISSTARGSAYHKVLELFPFAQWGEGLTAEEVLDTLVQSGRLAQEYREAVSAEKLTAFLNSPLAGRMSAALRSGRLWREQPFVLGLPANILNPVFPAQETVLIQGIVDVFFEEDGELVLADYKTDRVRMPQELINRYQIQLDYYAQALSRLKRMPVKEKILYSFALETQIPVV